jgi:hypothetical protein
MVQAPLERKATRVVRGTRPPYRDIAAAPVHEREIGTTTSVNSPDQPRTTRWAQGNESLGLAARSWRKVDESSAAETGDGSYAKICSGALFFQPTPLPGVLDGFVPVLNRKLLDDVVNVVLHGVNREGKLSGDLLVAEPVGDQVDDFQFARS